MKEQVQLHPVVVVEGTKLEKVEYHGQPVISLPMVDRAHKRPEGTAGRTFRKFRSRFIFGEDFFELPHEEWTSLNRRITSVQRGSTSVQKNAQGGRRGHMIFFTLSGYLMLVKPLTDDLSWKVQRMLVKNYFEATKTVAELKDELLDMYRKYVAIQSRKMNKVSDAEVTQIVELKKQGKQTSEIAREIGRDKSTVRRHAADARQLGLFDLAPGQGWMLPEVR